MKLYPEKLNRRFDKLREPKRFAVTMILISPLFFASSFPIIMVQAGLMLWAAALMFLRAAYLCKLEFMPRREPPHSHS